MIRDIHSMSIFEEVGRTGNVFITTVNNTASIRQQKNSKISKQGYICVFFFSTCHWYSMDRKPEVSELLEWLEELSRWKKFGTHLPAIKTHDLEKIEEEEHRADNRKIALFDKWLRVYPGANWGHVITALEKAKEEVLVEKVKKKLGLLPVAKAGEEMVDGQENADKEVMVNFN